MCCCFLFFNRMLKNLAIKLQMWWDLLARIVVAAIYVDVQQNLFLYLCSYSLQLTQHSMKFSTNCVWPFSRMASAPWSFSKIMTSFAVASSQRTSSSVALCWLLGRRHNSAEQRSRKLQNFTVFLMAACGTENSVTCWKTVSMSWCSSRVSNFGSLFALALYTAMSKHGSVK